MPKTITRELIECPCQDGVTVATDEPVLQRVKIVGYASANRRRYTEEAIEGAIQLYEGCLVNLNHPSRPNETRNLRDRFGRLETITRDEEGAWGNLRYNPEHADAKSVCWFAENMPEALGLSHNAVGQGHDENGTFVVEKIISVRSVDLVADPATTRGLREDVQSMTTQYTDSDTQMDSDEAPDHQQALKQGFRAACVAILDDESMDAKTKCDKLKKLLTTHEKLADDEVTDDEEDDETGADDQGDEGGDLPMDESIKALASTNPAVAKVLRRLDTLESKQRVAGKRRLAERLIAECRLPRIAVTELFMSQLIESRDVHDMRALIQDRKRIASIRAPSSATGRPIGGGPTISKEDFKKHLLAGHR